MMLHVLPVFGEFVLSEVFIRIQIALPAVLAGQASISVPKLCDLYLGSERTQTSPIV